jgi:hypothetical protein
MIDRKKHIRNGVTYTIIEDSKEINAALTMGSEKFVLTGIPAIELTKNSYKFDKEVQITVFNKIGSTKKVGRVPYAIEYDRIEIFLDRKVFLEMCQKFMHEMVLEKIESGE